MPPAPIHYSAPPLRPVLGLLALLWLSPSAAQVAPPPAAEPGSAQRVEVTGESQADGRREGTTARTVVGREEILRHGDSSVLDVLRRVSGVTVTGTPGRGATLRLRGLGSGYTQVLVNGEPMPAGFALESLAPAQIERIEISRVGTADVGAQAIAGTINFVLRQRVPAGGTREFKLGAGGYAGNAAHDAEAQLGRRADAWSYSLGAGLRHKRDEWPTGIDQQGFDAAGAPVLARHTQRRAQGREDGFSATPRASWREDGDSFGADGLLRWSRFSDDSRAERQARLGPLPSYGADELSLALRTLLARVRLNGTHQLASEATVEARLSSTLLRRQSDAHFEGFDTTPALVMVEHVDSRTTEITHSAGAKLRLPYTRGHAVALGGDAELSDRDEDREQRQTSPTGRAVTDLDEAYRARVTQGALYLQDEWDLGETFSLYAGLRHAALRTRTQGLGLASAARRDAVTSPVLQALWKPAGAQGGSQWRLAFSRSWRAPRTRDLVPRRFVATDNTPTTPDLQGNPALRPELAWGLDLAWEHHLADGAGLLSAGLAARDIRDVIVEELRQDSAGWVSRKANNGRAQTWSLELEARLRLNRLWPGAADVDLRLNAARNDSRVRAVPGPDNRLDEQVPYSANLALDWKAATLPLTWGASLGVQGGVRARTSLTQSTRSRDKTTLDLYALWAFSRDLKLRLSGSNLLRPTGRVIDTYADAAGRLEQQTETPSFAVFRAQLELSF